MTIDPPNSTQVFNNLEDSISHQLRSVAAVMMSFARRFATPPKTQEGQPWYVVAVIYILSLCVSVLFLAGCLAAILGAGVVLLVSKVTRAVCQHVAAKKEEAAAGKPAPLCNKCDTPMENVFTMGWTCPNCHKDDDTYPEQVRKTD